MNSGILHNEGCSHKRCCKKSMWYPIVRVWHKGCRKTKSEAMEVEIGLSFCQEHKDNFKPTDVKSLDVMVGALASSYQRPEPDMSTAEVEMRPLILG